jgi:hypothetical protein
LIPNNQNDDNKESTSEQWSDKTLLNLIADRYHHMGMTGAEAIVAVWAEIVDGKLPQIREELGIPEELGVIHAINTLSKELGMIGMLHIPKTDKYLLK